MSGNGFSEILALMHWDERLVRAFQRAKDEYIAAGSPGIPMTAVDFRKRFTPRQSTKDQS